VKRNMVAAAGLLLLAACGRSQSGNEAAQPAGEPVNRTLPAPAAPAPARAPAPAAATPFYVGRWAPRAELCGAGAWLIDEKGLHTAGEISCRFDGAPQGAGPVEVEATCLADGMSRKWRLRMAYAQSARALLVENGPFADTGLVRCGPLPARAETPSPSASNAIAPDEARPDTAAEADAAAAADVLRRYVALLAVGQSAEARRLWTEGGEAGGGPPEAFADSLGDQGGYDARIGPPGRIEGAAGSLYVQIPITLATRAMAGASMDRAAIATLRRSNDVPGASDEQRRWHIHRIEMR